MPVYQADLYITAIREKRKFYEPGSHFALFDKIWLLIAVKRYILPDSFQGGTAGPSLLFGDLVDVGTGFVFGEDLLSSQNSDWNSKGRHSNSDVLEIEVTTNVGSTSFCHLGVAAIHHQNGLDFVRILLDQFDDAPFTYLLDCSTELIVQRRFVAIKCV